MTDETNGPGREPVAWMASALPNKLGAVWHKFYDGSRDTVSQRATYACGYDCTLELTPLYAAAQAVAGPPREPNQEMLNASPDGMATRDALACWRAMWDAAPPPAETPAPAPADITCLGDRACDDFPACLARGRCKHARAFATAPADALAELNDAFAFEPAILTPRQEAALDGVRAALAAHRKGKS